MRPTAVWKVHKILVPVTFENAAEGAPHAVAFTPGSLRTIQRAAWLARRFQAEIILLHVVTSVEYPYGLFESGHEITARDLETHVIQRANELLEHAPLPELEGIPVTRLLRRGDPAREIVETVHAGNVDLIVISHFEDGALYQRLLGSVTAKILHDTGCPIWTDPEDAPVSEFSIDRVLCAVELRGHSHFTVSQAAGMAAANNAVLTLVHITSSVETWGPGGNVVDPAWKSTIVGYASEEIAKVQRKLGTDFAVIIDSGNVPEMLNRAAERTKADLLVVGHIPGRSHLGNNGNGYGIVRQSRIPVLSVCARGESPQSADPPLSSGQAAGNEELEAGSRRNGVKIPSDQVQRT